MAFSHFLCGLNSDNCRWSASRMRRGSRRRKERSAKPLLEALEDRTVLSPYMVTTTADSGSGSLRDAINQVNTDTNHTYANPTDPTKDEIDFAIPASDPEHHYYKNNHAAGSRSHSRILNILGLETGNG